MKKRKGTFYAIAIVILVLIASVASGQDKVAMYKVHEITINDTETAKQRDKYNVTSKGIFMSYDVDQGVIEVSNNAESKYFIRSAVENKEEVDDDGDTLCTTYFNCWDEEGLSCHLVLRFWKEGYYFYDNTNYIFLVMYDDISVRYDCELKSYNN